MPEHNWGLKFAAYQQQDYVTKDMQLRSRCRPMLRQNASWFTNAQAQLGRPAQEAFRSFLIRCEALEFEPEIRGTGGRMSARDMQRLARAGPHALADKYLTLPVSELDVSEWKVGPPCRFFSPKADCGMVGLGPWWVCSSVCWQNGTSCCLC